MYRRLKNLLGVSFVILAIVLAQMPMPQVQADIEESNEQMTQTEGVTEETQPTPEVNTVLGTGNENNASEPMAAAEDDLEDGTPANDGIMPIADSFTVTLNYGLSGLTGSTTSLTAASGATITLGTITVTTDAGTETLTAGSNYVIGAKTYKFRGWYRDAAGATAWNFTTDTVSADMTLYAIWNAADDRIVKITYSASDADVEAERLQVVEVQAGAVIQKPAKEPTRSGWRFVEWVTIAGDPTSTVDWSMAVTTELTLYATWTQKSNTVTFDANGGTYSGGSLSVEVAIGSGLSAADYPASDDFTNGTMLTDSNWYTDTKCLNAYATETDGAPTVVTQDLTLYKRWFATDTDGFTLSADGTVLYSFEGTQESVVIPDTVTTIASGAFYNMRSITRITLPARISDIRENAFSGMNAADFIVRTIYIYSTTSGGYSSKVEGQKLADKYENFSYVASAGETVNTDSVKLNNVNCSLVDVDRAVDESGNPLYPKVTLPYDLENGDYNLVFTELGQPDYIDNLLKTAGYNLNSGYVYYMDITLKKQGAIDSYKPSWSKGILTITMPLPTSWYGRDASKIKVLAVSEDHTSLDTVTLDSISNNIMTFIAPHFSEYALVYTGTLTSSSTGGGGSSTGGSSQNNNSGGDSSSSGSSSSTSTAQTTTTATQQTVAQPDASVTLPQILPTETMNPDTQPTVTPSQGTTASTSAHVKDATPKTGDPLEYRSLLVCSFFSIGVLLLLIGNKKKTFSSSPNLQS